MIWEDVLINSSVNHIPVYMYQVHLECWCCCYVYFPAYAYKETMDILIHQLYVQQYDENIRGY